MTCRVAWLPVQSSSCCSELMGAGEVWPLWEHDPLRFFLNPGPEL